MVFIKPIRGSVIIILRTSSEKNSVVIKKQVKERFFKLKFFF